MTPDRLTAGDIDIFVLKDGEFLLDGGAMFGVVPKTLWSKKCPPDRENRIRLSLNCFLIRKKKEIILVETGIGSILSRKYEDIYAVKKDPGLIPSLRELGHRPEDIGFVINTHLHFDHCGGNTVKDEKGDHTPAFPMAAYIIQEGEWEYALRPSERDKPSYLAESFLPLEKSGNLRLIRGSRSITEGVEAVLVPGHTAHHQCVRVASKGQVVFLLGDLVPTSAHVGLPYIMSYDLFPLQTLENKKRLFDRGIRENWIFAFDHDPAHFFGRVGRKIGKYEFLPLEKNPSGEPFP